MEPAPVTCPHCGHEAEVNLSKQTQLGLYWFTCPKCKRKCVLKVKEEPQRRPLRPEPQGHIDQAPIVFTAYSQEQDLCEEREVRRVPKLIPGPVERLPREAHKDTSAHVEPSRAPRRIGRPIVRKARVIPDRRRRELPLRTKGKERPGPRYIRTRVASILLILVGILGISSGIAMSLSSDSEGIGEQMDEGGRTSISGKVVDKLTGRGIEGASVSLVDEGAVTTTNGEGFFLIQNVKNGEHTLVVKKQGYITRQRVVDVDSRSTGTVLISMSEGVGTVEDETPSMEQGNSNGTSNFTIAVTLFISVLAFIGAWLILRRTHFHVALILALPSPLSFGFGFGLVLAILALCFLMAAKDEFEVNEADDVETF